MSQQNLSTAITGKTKHLHQITYLAERS